MYDNGINAAKGLVKGLTKQKKTIEKTMMDIAKSMVKAIKKTLGIKSPSRVMARIGDWTADGLVGALRKRVVDVGEIAARWGEAISKKTWEAAKKVAQEARQYEAATVNANASGSDAAYVRGNSRTTLPAQTIVHVHVAGSVTAEKDLAKAISGHVRDEIIRISKRNGGRSGL